MMDNALTAAAETASTVVDRLFDKGKHTQLQFPECLEIDASATLKALEESNAGNTSENPTNSMRTSPVMLKRGTNAQLPTNSVEMSKTSDVMTIYCFVCTAFPAFSAMPIVPYLCRLRDNFFVTSSNALRKVQTYHSPQARRLLSQSSVTSVLQEYAEKEKSDRIQVETFERGKTVETPSTTESTENAKQQLSSNERFINSLKNRSIVIKSPFLTEVE
jgi:hypothetical protein